MQSYDFQESLGYWLTVTSQAVHRRLDELLAPQDITFRQSHVIGWLALLGEAPQCELAKRMLIEPPTLVRLLDHMERRGWIERVEAPSDRRQKLVRLTAAAEPVWDRIVASARQVRREAAEGLTGEEVQVLNHLCERILGNLQRREETVSCSESGSTSCLQ